MRALYHPEAMEEYCQAAQYYAEIHRELGEAFSMEVEAAVDRALAQPQAWQGLGSGFRRCNLRRFPYGVVYKVKDEDLFVYAVMHLSRRPSYWRQRT